MPELLENEEAFQAHKQHCEEEARREEEAKNQMTDETGDEVEAEMEGAVEMESPDTYLRSFLS